MSELGKNKVGSFLAGSFNKLILRQKSDEEFELGQLLVAGENIDNFTIFKINDIRYGSQIPQGSLELMAGYQLEKEHTNLRIYEPELRNYILAQAKPLINVRKNALTLPKKLPKFFSEVYELTDAHLKFMKETELDNPLTLGKVRSGSKMLDTPVSLEALEVIIHHILIPATTGRGKSNLVKVILYSMMENEKCGKLVFDPHNEYYEGLKLHPESSKNLKYYTIRAHPKKIDLKFNCQNLRPNHIISTITLSNAQKDALIVYYRADRDNGYKNWIKNIFTAPVLRNVDNSTIGVLRRKISILLNLDAEDDEVNSKGIYTFDGYESTLNDIVKFLKAGKTVVIDTSLFTGKEEVFVSSLIVEKVFTEYKKLKFSDQMKNYPVISIVLEEAPRVIGKRVLEVGDNIFGTIAREGRKFNIGLIAITQLPSIIPREILANMNTKIILGNEMGPERKAIIESAAQDLSEDYQTIGSLDKGEAIITSNFTKFAIPIKIPLFEELVKEDVNAKKELNQKVKKRSQF